MTLIVTTVNVTSTADVATKASPLKWAPTIAVCGAMIAFLVISFIWRYHQRMKAKREIEEAIINSWNSNRPFSTLYGHRSEAEAGGISYMLSQMIMHVGGARFDVGYMGNGNVDGVHTAIGNIVVGVGFQSRIANTKAEQEDETTERSNQNTVCGARCLPHDGLESECNTNLSKAHNSNFEHDQQTPDDLCKQDLEGTCSRHTVTAHNTAHNTELGIVLPTGTNADSGMVKLELNDIIVETGKSAVLN